MMRKGLQITLCLAVLVQASVTTAQQQTQYNSPTRPANQMGEANNLPPMVRPDQFGRQEAPTNMNRATRQQIQAPRRLSPEEQAQFRAQQVPVSQTSSRQSLANDPRTVTFTDQPGNVRQVSYTQDGVPVPSILGSQPQPTAPLPKTPAGQSPAVTGEPIEVPKLASVPAEMQQTAQKTEDARPVEATRFQPAAIQTPVVQQQPASQPLEQPAKAEVGAMQPVQQPSAKPGVALDSQRFPLDSTGSGGSFNNPIRSTSNEVNPPARTTPKAKITEASIERNDNSTSATVTTQELDQSTAGNSRGMSDRVASNFKTVEMTAKTGSQIQTEGPQLKVATNGPSSIGIGKPARYEVFVINEGRTTANDVIVGVGLPGWIEVKNVNTTQGTREAAEGTADSRLIWNVKQIAAGTSEKMIIDVVAREAKMFDLNVEWTVMPITGTASVQVTEPRLDVEISGPNEVHFGDNTMYSVTVSNPGTGIAENVSVMLPEALGGERAPLGDIQPGRKMQIQVELVARQSGTIELSTIATADGELRQTDSRNVLVRRAELDVQIAGPQMKYAGSVATYEVVVSNTGDAIAQEVLAALALPNGVEYLSGLEAVEKVQGGLRWNVGTLSPGTQQTFHVNCQLNQAGEMSFEVASRGKGDLATTGTAITNVEAIADLVLSVEDPKGPLPTGQDVVYTIQVKNRGSKIAHHVEMVMQFAEGIEPTSAQGHQYELVTGQVLFAPIEQIDPGQEITLKVTANAGASGQHVYRAQLLCEESHAREVAEGTTKFYDGNGGAESKLRTGHRQEVNSSGSFRK